MPFKILHTADLHLGQILYNYYDRVDEHDHFFAQLVQWCEQYSPDALIVSGDVFDIQQPSAATKEHFNRTFVGLHRRFPHMAIVVTAGNHDSASRLEADSPVWGLSGVTLVGHAPANDAVLEGNPDAMDRYIVELPQGFIVAVPFMTTSRPAVLQALLDRVAERNSDCRPVVMTGHLAVSGGDFTGHGEVGTIKTVDANQMGHGFDYLALGHIHRPQTLGYPLNDEYTLGTEASSAATALLGTEATSPATPQPHHTYPSGIMRYSGSPLHVSCDEAYPHSVSLVDIDRHGGTVGLRRLRVDELRHFHTLPEAGAPPASSFEEVMQQVNDFCRSHERGYIRLRIDYGTPLPPDFAQAVYSRLEATGNEVRFNPKTIWENINDSGAEAKSLKFEVAELQQMTDPMDFIRRTANLFPEFDIEDLEADFDEIKKELLCAS